MWILEGEERKEQKKYLKQKWAFPQVMLDSEP